MRTMAAEVPARRRTAASPRPAEHDLRVVLDELLSQMVPARRIAVLEARPMRYASSFALEEITVRFDDGGTLVLVCKDTGDAAMLPDARRIKPRFLLDPMREIATYERILEPLAIDAPRFYGSAIDERCGRYWLFLERVPGQPLTEIGDFDVWRQASAWLARMHSRTASASGGALAAATTTVPLVRYDRTHWRLWMTRAERRMQRSSVEPRARRLRFAGLVSRYESVVEEVVALPAGFIHGEFFASNVLVQAGAAGRVRVRPLDWELAGIGPRLVDLAALVAGRWSDRERTALAKSYHAALERNSDTWLPQEAFRRALDCCRLLIAVQRLGWAAQWTPPAAHIHDWLGDVLRAAERIGL